jgi:hypothetical protein
MTIYKSLPRVSLASLFRLLVVVERRVAEWSSLWISDIAASIFLISSFT